MLGDCEREGNVVGKEVGVQGEAGDGEEGESWVGDEVLAGVGELAGGCGGVFGVEVGGDDELDDG